jgi:hypothetical protein
MSLVLSRRVLVVAAILALVAAAFGLALATRPQVAQAQAGPAHDTEVIANIVAPTDSRGEIHLGIGTGSAFVPGAACNPAGPRGGSNIPGQMVSDFQSDELVLRVFHLNGTVLANTNVRFTCTVDFGEGAPPAAQAAAAKLRSMSRNP